ncbi:hypothetical protein RAD16_35270 [Bradyrhizobium sp. 18BD]
MGAITVNAINVPIEVASRFIECPPSSRDDVTREGAGLNVRCITQRRRAVVTTITERPAGPA